MQPKTQTSICPPASTSGIKEQRTFETAELSAFTIGPFCVYITRVGCQIPELTDHMRSIALTFCPDRSLSHHAVHDLAQQMRADPLRNFRVAICDCLQITRRIYIFKVDMHAVVLCAQEHSTGSGGVTNND